MSVQSHLAQRARDAVPSKPETDRIERSIGALEERLTSFFPGQIRKTIRFGSSTRSTMLPRAMDEQSDVDLMVVFNESGPAPQTHLDRLRRFVEKYYSRSEIYQSNPTVVLELEHIKFDLVPAIHSEWHGLRIPNGRGGWQDTDPESFGQRLNKRDSECDGLLRPAIRIVKYWNAVNGYVFNSYELEQEILSLYFPFVDALPEYVFTIFNDLSGSNSWAAWRQERLTVAKQMIREAGKENRSQKAALLALQKIIP
jgi:hypothetical protein